MAILLKNLRARAPHMEDLTAIAELIRLCENHEKRGGNNTSEGVLSEWQRSNSLLENNALIIVTTREQVVGFACLWHEADARISTFICVHPDYHNRGIGTTLLRITEARAREYARLTVSNEQVILQGIINKANEGARLLFAQEGYLTGHSFLRISFSRPEGNPSQKCTSAEQSFKIDIDLDRQGQLLTTPLWELDALCSVHVYHTYEKILGPTTQQNCNG